jgi:hypothetical protein
MWLNEPWILGFSHAMHFMVVQCRPALLGGRWDPMIYTHVQRLQRGRFDWGFHDPMNSDPGKRVTEMELDSPGLRGCGSKIPISTPTRERMDPLQRTKYLLAIIKLLFRIITSQLACFALKAYHILDLLSGYRAAFVSKKACLWLNQGWTNSLPLLSGQYTQCNEKRVQSTKSQDIPRCLRRYRNVSGSSPQGHKGRQSIGGTDWVWLGREREDKPSKMSRIYFSTYPGRIYRIKTS